MLSKKRIFIYICIVIILLPLLYLFVSKMLVFKYVTNGHDSQFCVDIVEVFNQCTENENYDCIFEANNLLNSKYPNEAPLQQILAAAFYEKGDRRQSLQYLIQSLTGQYTCENLQLSDKSRSVEEVIIRYNISRLYRELGDENQAATEEQKATAKLKEIAGENYTVDYENTVKSKNILQLLKQ